jgi:lanthanide-dependent methanol dehydrogenase
VPINNCCMDGGLVFYGSLGGDFRAVDRNSGKILWSRKLGSGIIGNPITWKVGGKQYVGTYSGIGGWIGLPVTAGLDLGDKFGAIGATDDQGRWPAAYPAGW